MLTFMLSLNWTDQGIRAVRDAPKRSQAARELAKKVGVEIKQIYLPSGEHDLLVIAEAPLGDHVTKFALAIGSLGNVRTRTSRAWTEPEWTKPDANGSAAIEDSFDTGIENVFPDAAEAAREPVGTT